MIEKPRSVFDSLRAAIERAGPVDSIDELNRLLEHEAINYNARPQAELGGLSPDQMYEILYGDWYTTGALRIRDDLPLDELSNAPLLADARALLEYVRDNAPLKETATGNLPRTSVAALLSRLRMPALARDAEFPPGSVVNEGDLIWLPVLRHTLLFAKLLTRRKGLRLARRGASLLAEERAGELYALLFETFFRKLDLRALDGPDGHVGLQPTIAYSFFQLRSCAKGWSSADQLAVDAWLETAKDPPSLSDVEYGDLRHWSFRHRVLDPLVQFGLLEERALPSKEKKWARPAEFRITPLYERFMRFEFR
jgi:hypothetical protein